MNVWSSGSLGNEDMMKTVAGNEHMAKRVAGK